MEYFTSDLHFGHANCIEMCSRPFADVTAMDEALIANWNDRVKRTDTVYIVGDLVWEKCNPLEYISRLNGKKILIVGNHDIKWLKKLGMARQDGDRTEFCGYSEYFNYIARYVEITVNGIKLTLCHYPMLEWRASRKIGSKKLGYLVHGHIHNSTAQKYVPLFVLPHALNATADINEYMPVSFDELVRNNERFKLNALKNDVDRALFVASKYHLYQTDKSGKPYIEHPKAVAAKQKNDVARCVALLHDVIEDTDIDVSIIDGYFSPEVGAAVRLLTHDKTVDYFDYVRKLAPDPVARSVKLADIAHNSDMSRIPHPTDEDFRRLKKYEAARNILLCYGVPNAARLTEPETEFLRGIIAENLLDIDISDQAELSEAALNILIDKLSDKIGYDYKTGDIDETGAFADGIISKLNILLEYKFGGK